MATYGEFAERLLHTLGAEPDATYSDALLYEACVNALNAILPWCPRQNTSDVSVTADHRSVTVPTDCWRIEAVLDNTNGLFLPRFEIRPGAIRRLTTDTSYKAFTDWMEYPKGTILLSNLTDVARSLTVFYLAYWGKPADKDDSEFALPMPESAFTGMIYYAAAHCLVPGSVNSAQIRQFNTKIDSGTPVDNSLEVEAKFLRQLFIEEMKQQPKFIGATQ